MNICCVSASRTSADVPFNYHQKLSLLIKKKKVDIFFVFIFHADAIKQMCSFGKFQRRFQGREGQGDASPLMQNRLRAKQNRVNFLHFLSFPLPPLFTPPVEMYETASRKFVFSQGKMALRETIVSEYILFNYWYIRDSLTHVNVILHNTYIVIMFLALVIKKTMYIIARELKGYFLRMLMKYTYCS